MQDILKILGPDHEISSKGTSIGTAKFAPELKTLTLIMFFNLYPLLNTGLINLGRAQFLCDLIIGVQIDISAHIFQLIGRTVAWTCLPFYSLLMKIMVLEGVHLPKDGKAPVHLRPLSMVSLQVSKSHSSKHLRVNLSLMPLLPIMAKLLTLRLCIPRQHLLTLLSCKQLALSLYILALKLKGWMLWLKVCINVFLDWKMFFTPPTAKFKCISQPLRHSLMLFNKN